MAKQIAHLVLPCADQSVGEARAFVRQRAGLWQSGPERIDDLVLVVSELVTNAVRHGRSGVDVVLIDDCRLSRLEVRDDDTRMPTILLPDHSALGGRGITVVAAISDRWGVEQTTIGKMVWAEIDAAIPEPVPS